MQLMCDITPKLTQLTDDVLFGQVWTGPELSPRDRSLVTAVGVAREVFEEN